MTSQLLVLGASLMDAGNISRASDGSVLGEQIAAAMGADPGSQQLVSLVNRDRPGPEQVHNYAHGGAESGKGPVLNSARTGFLAQVKAVRRHRRFYRQQPDVDVLISAGANDVLGLLEQPLTADLEDRRLVQSTARRISRNLRRGIDRLTGLVDEIAVVGAFPLIDTPLLQEQLSELEPPDAERLASVVNGIGRSVQRRLERHFSDSSSVVVLDLQRQWNRLAAPSFIDAVHPSSATTAELAPLIVEELHATLDGFGFSAG